MSRKPTCARSPREAAERSDAELVEGIRRGDQADFNLLYERYFFGDPVRMAGNLVNSHDRTRYMDRVRDFLATARDEAMAGA